MRKRFFALVVICVTISVNLIPAVPVSAATGNRSIFWKAALEGLYQCYVASGVIRKDFGTIAANFTNWDRIIEKDKGEDFIKLPTGYTDLNDSDVSCKELIGGYGSGGNSFEGLFGILSRTLPSQNSSFDSKKQFLTGMGYAESASGSGGKCVSFGYTRYTLGDENADNRFNFNIEKTEQVYSDSICISSVDNNGVIQSDEVEIMRGDSDLASIIEFSELPSGVRLFCHGGNITCDDQSFTVGADTFKGFADKIYRYVSIEAGGKGAPAGGSAYEIRSDGEICGTNTTGAVVCTDSGSVDISYTFSAADASVNKAMRYTSNGSYENRESLKFKDWDKVVLYQTYLMDYFNSNVICLEDTAENESAIANVQARGHQKVRLYRSGEFDPNCWALAGSNANSKVTGITGAGYFSVSGGVTMTFTDVVDALNGLTNITGLFDYLAEELGELVVSELPGNPTNPDTPSTPGGGEEPNDEPTCSIGVMGWIGCPVGTALGTLADGMIEMIKGMLQTPTSMLGTDTETAWRNFRDVANVIFVIFFLIVIFSQITGFGISNYGIKKILPKLILVALAVNLSFYICAIMIDLSNIVGSQIDKFLISTGVKDVEISWLELVLSGFYGAVRGTTIAAAATVGVLGVIMGGGWVAIILVLITAAIAVLFFFIIIAVRQIAIVILLVVSPIAFVCFLLPNTESIFKRWWKAFSMLLLVFPIVGLIDGVGTLGYTIIVASDLGTNFWIVMVAGLLPVLPAFLVPSMVKGSMAALGSIGGKLSGLQASLTGRARKGFEGMDWAKNQKIQTARNTALMKAGKYTGGGRLRRFGNRLYSRLNGDGTSDLAKMRARQAANVESTQLAENIRDNEYMYSNMSNDAVESSLTSAIKVGDEAAITAGVNHLANIGQGAMVYSAIRNAGNISNLNSAKALQSSIMGNSTLKQGFAPLANYAKKLVLPDGRLRSGSNESDAAHYNSITSFMQSGKAFNDMSDTQAKSLDYNLQKELRGEDRDYIPSYSTAAKALSDASTDPKVINEYISSFLSRAHIANEVATGITANGWGSMQDEVLDAMINGVDDGNGGMKGGISSLSGVFRDDVRDEINKLLGNPNANISATRRQKLNYLSKNILPRV